MYISPNHPNPPKTPAPPTENGKSLAVLPRGDGSELRITLAEFNSRPFISLRCWTAPDGSGNRWPEKGKGLSIKVRELSQVIAALEQAETLLADGTPSAATTAPPPRVDDPGAPKYRERRRRPEPRPVDGAALRAATTSKDFDETHDTGQAGQYDARNTKVSR